MIWIGTSGFSYPEWKGSFYPHDLSSAKMLAYYAARFSTVEINNTFYRMPNEAALKGWADGTPAPWKLTLKAPRRITHDSRLKECADALAAFTSRAATLGTKLGALLFQLPPFLKKDVAVLDAFLALMPQGVSPAFEFRHASWHVDEVFEVLRARNAALCIADSEKLSAPVVATADFGYFRLRDEGYEDADLTRWADVIAERAAAWRETFVYFKHEEAGKGPAFAKALMAKLRAKGERVAGTADVAGAHEVDVAEAPKRARAAAKRRPSGASS